MKQAIGIHAGKDTYAVRVNGGWQLIYWSQQWAMWVNGAMTLSYAAACKAIRDAERLGCE